VRRTLLIAASDRTVPSLRLLAQGIGCRHQRRHRSPCVFADQTAITQDACQWVVHELAFSLGVRQPLASGSVRWRRCSRGSVSGPTTVDAAAMAAPPTAALAGRFRSTTAPGPPAFYPGQPAQAQPQSPQYPPSPPGPAPVAPVPSAAPVRRSSRGRRFPSLPPTRASPVYPGRSPLLPYDQVVASGIAQEVQAQHTRSPLP